MKQTAVEWLVEEFKEKLTGNNLPNWVLDVIQQAKAMEKEQMLNTLKINRVEVIQHSEPYNGRAYINNNAKDVEIQFQDNNETLKIFLK
jgi:hypothetical protein